MTTVVGLVMWERRHAVRAELPGRTLCGIRTGLADVADVPGLSDFAGTGEAGFPACRRCLPMWRRVIELMKDKVSTHGIAGNTSAYGNVRMIIGGWVPVAWRGTACLDGPWRGSPRLGMAGRGTARPGEARLGEARLAPARHGPAGRGTVRRRLGVAGLDQVGHGSIGQAAVRQGKARTAQDWLAMPCSGTAGNGWTGHDQAWHGAERTGTAGRAGARHGEARSVKPWRGKAGTGLAWHGAARIGLGWKGSPWRVRDEARFTHIGPGGHPRADAMGERNRPNGA